MRSPREFVGTAREAALVRRTRRADSVAAKRWHDKSKPDKTRRTGVLDAAYDLLKAELAAEAEARPQLADAMYLRSFDHLKHRASEIVLLVESDLR